MSQWTLTFPACIDYGAHDEITTASPRGEALVKRLGADVVIDYSRERFEYKLSGYDCAFDLLGGDTLTRLWSVLKPGGRVVSIAGMPEPVTARKDLGRGSGLAALFWVASLTTRLRAARQGLSYHYLFMHPSGADLAYLASLIDAKKLVISVSFIRLLAVAWRDKVNSI